MKKTRSNKTFGRELSVKVKTARGRKISSTKWLQRQLNDPYVAAARKAGLRSRAAFKLEELDDKFKFLSPNMNVIELGAAPGGWTQVLIKKLRSNKPQSKSRILAIDLIEMAPIPGAKVLKLDFTSDEAPNIISREFNGKVNAVLSDMAPKITGHTNTDHIRTINLVEAAFDFTIKMLKPGGCFVSKVFQGGTEETLLSEMKKLFGEVKHAKPPSSRKESAELYVIAKNYRP
ncbi:MAG: RlmE family RNA methyltransferase [Rhodospirillaceae bacterium]|jgi:23S rRNA (uridine2552-2'-O)-methyltransferase|nr:RlmE family RNA methyltransferase [Rhodospirillaceae bacterium]